MKNTKLRTAVLAASLAAVVGIGGAAAYFSDSESATNTFTVGRIDISLTEPAWDTWNASDPAPIVPDQEIPKDPAVTNTGSNDAYVFMTVKVPTAQIVTAAENGTKQAQAAETQLFSYEVDDNWTLVSSGVTGGAAVTVANNTGSFGVHTAIPATGSEPRLGYVTYVYAYTGSTPASMERLEKQSAASGSTPNSTPALFDAVQFVNAVEGQGLETSAPSINVNAYAIQADFINDGDSTIDGTNGGSPKNAPADVWAVIQAQSSVSL